MLEVHLSEGDLDIKRKERLVAVRLEVHLSEGDFDIKRKKGSVA